MNAPRRKQGLVLVAVLFFVLLAVSGVATLLRRATVDGLIARNRDLAARCEALARGGVRLGIALLLQDRLDEEAQAFRAETLQDGWSAAGSLVLEMQDGTTLQVRIEDAGSRLNLNALFADGEARDPLTETLLVELLDKVIEELPGEADGNVYDAGELAQHLMDYVDADDTGLRGGLEDDVYQTQDPPYRAANRPLLSLEELRLVDGFDGRLVEALRPYVTVHPWARGDGINPNTAPPWVLALLYHGTSGDYRLADESAVRRVLDIREHDGILCANDAEDPRCTPLGDAVPGEVYPPPSFVAEVFRVNALARMGEVEREVFAVVDRSDAANPVLRAWQVR
jgi:general secretion pathway protein K